MSHGPNAANILLQPRVLAAEGTLAALALLAGCGAPDQSNQNGGSPSPAATVSASATPGVSVSSATPESTPSVKVIPPSEGDNTRADGADKLLGKVSDKICRIAVAQVEAGRAKPVSRVVFTPHGDEKQTVVDWAVGEKTAAQATFTSKKVTEDKCTGSVTVWQFATPGQQKKFLGGDDTLADKASSVFLANEGPLMEDKSYRWNVVTVNRLKLGALKGTIRDLNFGDPSSYRPYDPTIPNDEPGYDPQEEANSFKFPKKLADSVEKSAAFMDKAVT